MATWLSLELGTLRSTARPLHSAAGHAGSSSSSGKASLTSELSLKRSVSGCVGYLSVVAGLFSEFDMLL